MPRRSLERGKRVYLRAPVARDRTELIARSRASLRLHRPWITAPTSDELFDRWMQRNGTPEVESFLVCRLEDDAVVGVFTLSQIFRRAFQSAYLGYYALSPFAGQGYMAEGMVLLLRHIFKALKLHRVEANVQPENTRSIALVKRAGFRLEGRSPRYLKIGRRWRDHERWAITVEDWQRAAAAAKARAPRAGPPRGGPRTRARSGAN